LACLINCAIKIEKIEQKIKKMENKRLKESAKTLGAQSYLIKNVEIDCSISLFILIEKNARRTDGYYSSLLCKADDQNRSDKGFYDFIAIYWPDHKEDALEKAQDWAKKNNLKTIDIRDLVSICRKNIDIYWDFKFFDIIRLVSTSPIKGKYLTAQIEAETDVMIYLEEGNMMGGDIFFVFRLE
jgi:hypothetical protein